MRRPQDHAQRQTTGAVVTARHRVLDEGSSHITVVLSTPEVAETAPAAKSKKASK